MILAAMVFLLTAQSSYAQFDDLGDTYNAPPPPVSDDFVAPPPPSDFGPPSSSGGFNPGLPSSGGGGQATGSGRAGGTNDAGTGLMNNRQKEKFAKAQIEDITNANFPEMIDSFDYPNADITDVVKAISELTGKNFIIDPGVRGKITIIAPSKITVAEAYKAFLSALAINGYAVVPSGSFLKIRSARNAQRDGIDTYAGSYYPNSDQMITRIINLKHINAEAVNRDLRILTSKDGEMSIYPPTNSIILSDYGSNIERIMKIISQLDVPGFEDQLEVIPIRYAKAKDIAELVNKIVNKGETGQNNRGGTFSAGVPRFTRAATTTSTQGSAYFMVIPDERSNALVVTGNKAGIARIKKLLTQLDFRIRPEDAGGVYVYYVKNGDAEKIAQTLSGIAKDAAPKPSSGSSGGNPIISPVSGVQAAQQEIFGGDVKITADKGTNAIVIVASKQDYEVVLNLLNKIDIPRDQVFVEAILMEMKMVDALDWQVGYFKFDEGGSGAKVGFNGFRDQSTLQNILTNPAGGTGAILGFGSNDKITLKPPGATTATEISSLIGFVNFLKTNGNANILSNPQVLAMDNQEAELEVGDKVITGVRTTGGTTAGTTAVSEPIFEDATIKLKIKPFISPASSTVRMEMSASVKQLSTAKTPAGLQATSQPIATRSVKTMIVVPNKDTAVLGGLMKEDDNETLSKVPMLGDIPILGWLFKSRSTSREKTNLLMFLTPTIVRNSDDSRRVLGKKLDQRLNYIKSMGGRDPYGETVDQLQRPTATSQDGFGNGGVQ
ncbi:MAG: type II secretion system secretin GspD [Bdellovibrionaceae bacterium]|nr:type II secretion system secretin GspD [Pseudobdellovibrionaceae bacterium]